MRVTLNKISKEIGYSVSAISQVLNNHPNASTLKDETRQKILNAVKNMGYRRNDNAAEIRTGICKTIALITDFDSFLMDSSALLIFSGTLMAASEEGYGVKVYDSSRMEHNFDEILRYGIKYVINFSFDEASRTQVGNFCRKYELELCYLQERGVDGFPVIYSNDSEGIRQLVHYFYDRGHRRIAMISPDVEVACAVMRRDGYFSGLLEVGLKPDKRYISSRHHLQANRKDIERMMGIPCPERPTAFICSDDTRAMLVTNEAVRQGRDIPRECCISGFGNTISANLIVPVSSITQPFREIGAAGLKTVVGKPYKRYAKADNTYLLPTGFIERESTKITLK